MNQQWTLEELLASWMLTDTEKVFINSRYTDTNKVGFGTLFKYFQQDGRFPQRKQDIPEQIVLHIAQQLALQPKEFHAYRWTEGTIDRHRARIRSFLGFRICTAQDVVEITQWLSTQELPGDERQPDRLKDVVYARFRDRKIEPPELKSVDRLIHSALRRAD